VGIVYLGLNKSKAKKFFMNYMMIVQLFFTVIGLSLFGYYVGNRINPDSSLPILLTAVGLSLGVIIGFVTILQFMKSEERHERRSLH
jgi:ABC-type lipoprotein release transport system permease subunit